MDNREPIWSFGESQLLYDPSDSLDVVWSFGESFIFDEYVAAGGHSPSASPSEGTPSLSPSGSPSGSPSTSPSASPSGSPSATPSISPSASPSEGTPSASPSGTTLTEGSTTWGRATSDETNTRTFVDNWMGDGEISGSGDSEIITLDGLEYMESEVVSVNAQEVQILIDNYDTGSGGPVTIEYKDGDSEENCLSDSWNSYVESFVSSGYIKIKVSNV